MRIIIRVNPAWGGTGYLILDSGCGAKQRFSNCGSVFWIKAMGYGEDISNGYMVFSK